MAVEREVNDIWTPFRFPETCFLNFHGVIIR